VRRLLFTLPAVLVCGCGASHNETAAIERAVRAPLRAYMNQQAGALCSSFTAAVAARFAPGARSCGAGAARAFHAMEYVAIYFPPDQLPKNLKIAVSSHGTSADVTTTWPWRSPAHIRLTRGGRTWLIASTATLVEDVACGTFLGEHSCGRTFSIVFGPTPARTVSSIPPAHGHVVEQHGAGGVVWRSES
jgi:hypothetical protein